jgi:hypothetical protein
LHFVFLCLTYWGNSVIFVYLGDQMCIFLIHHHYSLSVALMHFMTNNFACLMQLCTLEFETRRASYYWLLHALGIYQPYVWEYSRLNISNTVMSKRKVRQHLMKLYQYKPLYCTVYNFPVLYFELFSIEA